MTLKLTSNGLISQFLRWLQPFRGVACTSTNRARLQTNVKAALEQADLKDDVAKDDAKIPSLGGTLHTGMQRIAPPALLKRTPARE
jgi:hypothetical protein